MEISLVVPSRNNLKYFTWMYDSVRKNSGRHDVYICAAADACTDGTEEYFKQLAEIDKKFTYLVNPGPDRLGHTVLYDRIVKELVKTEIAMIWHSDMYLMPDALDAIENTITRKRIVSLTRIEPPLHPPGPEKILMDFGVEPEEFKEQDLLEWYSNTGFFEHYVHNNSNLDELGCTNGIFAPWAFYVDDFIRVGGHSQIFRPQSKEDCILYDTLLLVEIDGQKKAMTVDELWDIFESDSYVRDDGKTLISLKDKSVRTITAYPDGSMGFAKINGLIKKTVDSDSLVRVRTNWGEVVVTKDHSLLDSKSQAAKAIHLKAGNVWEPTKLIEDSFRRGSLNEIGFSSFFLIEKNNSIPYNFPKIGDIDEYGNNQKLINICEFLGFFVAKGSTHIDEENKQSGITIRQNDKQVLDYFKEKSISLFFDTDIWGKVHTSKKEECGDVFSYTKRSKHLSFFMLDLVGHNSENKKVPDFIFDLPKVYQEAFLYGYLCGDGYLGTSVNRQTTNYSFSVDKRMFFKENVFDFLTWESTSSSKKLTFGINILLRKCFPGIKTRINYQSERSVWNLSTCKFYKKDILEIEDYKTNRKEECVYDLEVRNTNTFVGGVGLMGLHNSDIFNRFALSGYELKQTWTGYVYHMTCRGSRRNTIDGAPDIYTNNPEWERQNERSTKEFIRIWGTPVLHDEFMLPIIPPRYLKTVVITDSIIDLVRFLEPFFDYLNVSKLSKDGMWKLKKIIAEIQETSRHTIDYKLTSETTDVTVYVKPNFSKHDALTIQQLPQIIEQSVNEPGDYELGSIMVRINKWPIDDYRSVMMNANSDFTTRQLLPGEENSIF